MRFSDGSSAVCSSDRSRRLWGGDLPSLPLGGRGTMRSMVEGHARCFLSFIRNAAPPVPLHHLRWSPSPFQGGSPAIGRNPPSFSTQKKHPPKRPDPGGVPTEIGSATCRARV